MKNIDPLDYYNENYFNIEEQKLREIHSNNPPSAGLTRFFNSLADFVFGVTLVDIEEETKILLFYAEYKKQYKSISVPIPIEDHRLANDVTVILSRRVCEINPNKDFFNVYNTFQHHRQSALEQLDYFTFNPFKSPKGTLISANQKIIPIEKLDRIDVLKELYSDVIDKPHLDPENQVYLMVDNRTGLIKIGRSKNPQYRERTLQSQEPETFLITCWTAPGSIEKELHKRYAKYRKRGEWFRLGFKELDEIKEFMNGLEL